jgi:hypothetical protein
MSENKEDCAHPPCNCSAGEDGSYCSESCEEAGEDSECGKCVLEGYVNFG